MSPDPSIRAVKVNLNGTTDDRLIPVTPGEWYDASVQAATVKCPGSLVMRFFNAAGANVQSDFAGISNNVPSSSTNPDLWPRYWRLAQASTDAAYMTVDFRKDGTSSGNNSSLFLWKPMVALSHAAATAPTPWSPAGTTVIDGGRVITKSITAEKIDVNTLSAITANIGLMRTATTGQRVEISSNRIVVYGPGQSIIVLGDLTGF